MPTRTANTRSPSSPAGASWAPVLARRHLPVGVGIDKIKGLKTLGGDGLDAPPVAHGGDFNTLVEIDPKPGDESVTADIVLDRGRTLKGKLVGPDGEPVAGALMMGGGPLGGVVGPIPPLGRFRGALARVRCKARLLFYHKAKQLAGA